MKPSLNIQSAFQRTSLLTTAGRLLRSVLESHCAETRNAASHRRHIFTQPQ